MDIFIYISQCSPVKRYFWAFCICIPKHPKIPTQLSKNGLIRLWEDISERRNFLLLIGILPNGLYFGTPARHFFTPNVHT